MTTTAFAIRDIADTVIVLCPLCSQIHEHPSATGRLTVQTPAPCAPDQTYAISATMRDVSFASAIKGYIYDLDKKKRSNQRARDARRAAKAEGEPRVAPV